MTKPDEISKLIFFTNAMKHGFRDEIDGEYTENNIPKIFNEEEFPTLQSAINNTILKKWSTKEKILEYSKKEIFYIRFPTIEHYHILQAIEKAVAIAPFHPITHENPKED